jgi:hypothetical protein
VVVSALLMGHLLLTRDQGREAMLALTIGLFGFAMDTLQASAGLYAFAHASTTGGGFQDCRPMPARRSARCSERWRTG